MQAKQFLSVTEAARVLNVHTETVRRLLTDGTLQAIQNGFLRQLPAPVVVAALFRTCEQCGRAFVPGRYVGGRQRFCSDRCRWTANDQAKASARAAAADPDTPPADVDRAT